MKLKLSIEESNYLQIIEKTYNSIIPQLTRKPKNYKLSPPIALEVVDKFLKHRDLIETSHQNMKGTEHFKIAGYLTYWLAKLKPVQILEPSPDKDEILINEYLSLSVAINYINESVGILMLSQKLIEDLRYTLRYRTLTVRTLPIIYDAYANGLNDKNKL